MPYTGLDSKGQSSPHLGVYMGDGTVLAVPEGAQMFIVSEGTDKKPVTVPVILMKVKLNQMVFRCNCGEKSCTQVYKFAASKRGMHRSDKA